MIPKKQTRLHNPPESIGNCFPAVIASILEMDVVDIIQIQMWYEEDNWEERLNKWLKRIGWRYRVVSEDEIKPGEYYFVAGKYPKDEKEYHVCIFKDGALVHDPHPNNCGLLTMEEFSILEKIK